MTPIPKPITLVDTSIATRNVGDEIITNAVMSELGNIFSANQILHIPSHNYLTLNSYKCLRESSLAVVGGSNLLSSNMPFYQQWKIQPLDLIFMREFVLLGVGWWQYQKKPNYYTRIMLKSLFSQKYMHSVRDQYTENMLKSIGIKNVLNTSCPTMWHLTDEHCRNIPKEKADNVIYTLTDYNQDPVRDMESIKTLRNSYKTISIWLQGSKDHKYLESLGVSNLIDRVIPPQLKYFDLALDEENIEYVGTRLHAGIRALQKSKRSLIIAVDNRGMEKKKDYNLHVIPRTDITNLKQLIFNDRPLNLRMDFGKINQWRNQFND